MNYSRALATASLTLALAVPAAAQKLGVDESTSFTFSGPVQVPGMTLPAGRYEFRMARSMANQQVLEIWNEDRTKMVTTVLTVPTTRLDNSGDVYITFAGTPASDPPAIKSWFHPGDRIGHLFVYPREQALRIAQTTKELVLSSDDDRGGDVTTATNFWILSPEGKRERFSDDRSYYEASERRKTGRSEDPFGWVHRIA